VGFDVLTTCQPSTVWCSRERLPAAAAQPAKVRQSCSATYFYFFYYRFNQSINHEAQIIVISQSQCDRFYWFDEHRSLESGVMGGSCELICASASSLSLCSVSTCF
jgi:hypothetical protein